MTPEPAPRLAPRAPARAGAVRAVLALALWLVLMPSLKPGDLAMGAFAAGCATWVSLHLLPPAAGTLRFAALLALLPHFLWESVLGGLDVARRAFAPRMPLAPGYVKCPLDLPPGMARNTFATITSLMPGAVPAGEDEDALVYHCLDTSQPVVEQLWEEERLLTRALVAGRRHG